MKITTKTGDNGMTSNLFGERISKNSLEIEFVGEIDELQAFLGSCKVLLGEGKKFSLIDSVQDDLYMIMALVSSKGQDLSQIEVLEKSLIRMESVIAEKELKIGKLKEFIKPGKDALSTSFHIARTVCRRCERVVAGTDLDFDGAIVLKYLNRLSDLLFVLAV